MELELVQRPESRVSPYELTIARRSLEQLTPFFASSDRVLDVGSGTGLLASLLAREVGATVTCTDVIDINLSELPLTLFDGQRLPFPDNAFTACMCNFVLHHTRDHEALVREMMRVCSGRIVIMEDLVESPLDWLLTRLHTLISYWRYRSRGMSFRSDWGWRSLFYRLALKLEQEVPVRRWSRTASYPVARKLYVLAR